MMRINIRTITLGLDWESSDKNSIENTARTVIERMDAVLNAEGLEVKTKRVVIPPINKISKCSLPAVNNTLEWLSSLCERLGIRWFCVPIDTVGTQNLEFDQRLAFDIIRRHPQTFLNFIVARDSEIHPDAGFAAAKLIKQISRLSKNGYDNFRIGVSANCVANTPYFPFTYHQGESGFSVALELAAPIFEILSRRENHDLVHLREEILSELSPGIEKINSICQDIAERTGFSFKGIDLSLAPLPGEQQSVGRIVELLGVDMFGCSGTLFATSYLKDILAALISRTKIVATGFCGVMYSLLEDSGLCRANNSRAFTADSLISFSSVCGCGLDMVPLPGNVFESELAAIILDVCGLSTALRKPLGVRVLPIPLKLENESTDFVHDFLYNTRIMDVRHRMCHPQLHALESFHYARDEKPSPSVAKYEFQGNNQSVLKVGNKSYNE